MPIFGTSSGELSRWYVSNAKEATIGVAQTLDRSFFAISNNVSQKETQSKRKGVTGYQNAIQRVREKKFSGGQIVDNLYPAIVNWAMRHLFGAAPTNALVGASTTVFSHTWAAITLPPSTFTMLKQHANIAGVTETLAGLGITEVVFKSIEGVMSIEVKIDGLGAGYVIGAAAPAVDPLVDDAQDVMIGTNSNLLINDVSLSKGLFGADWQITITPGFGLLPTAGSTDGSVTRFDKVSQRNVVAVFDRYAIDDTMLQDFEDEVDYELTFRAIGPTIDAPNSLTSLVEITIPKARAVNEAAAHIGDMSTFKMPQVYEAIIDTSLSPAVDVQVKTQDLTAAP